MKTRKYQLMLRAYLRGQLQLQRPITLRDKIRERLLLQAIDADEQAEAAKTTALMAASVIGSASLEGAARRRLYTQLRHELENAEMLRRLDYNGIAELQAEISGSTATRVYDILEREGLVGDMPDSPDNSDASNND